MTSTRLILAFLGIILLVTVILSRGRLIESIKNRVSSILPNSGETQEEAALTITPTETQLAKNLAPTSEPVGEDGSESTPRGEIPSTGPQTTVYLLSGLGLAGGIYLKNRSRKK